MSKLTCDKNIGEVIRQLRVSKELKQSEVISFLQLHGVPMTKSSYSKIESGRQHVKISELIVLKKCLGVRYDDIFLPLE